MLLVPLERRRCTPAAAEGSMVARAGLVAAFSSGGEGLANGGERRVETDGELGQYSVG